LSNSVIIVLFLAFTLVAALVVPRWFIKRAIPKVIRLFRERDAINQKNARTLDELGLKPRGMLEGMFKLRDYRQNALITLIKIGIIQTTEDNRLYLSEEKLADSSLGNRDLYYR